MNFQFLQSDLAFYYETLAMLTKFPYKCFSTYNLKVWIIYANFNLLMLLIIYWPSFSWKKSGASIFSTSWHVMKFKLSLGIPLDKWSWLVTSSTWSRDFIWKWFLVWKLQISHVIKTMTSSILSFCQGLSLVQVSTSYHKWKLSFHP